MKLFTKIALGIAAFFLSIALISGIIAVSLGLTPEKFKSMVRNDAFSISFGNDNEISFFGGDVKWEHEDEIDWNGEGRKIIEQDCKNLELEMEAGQVEICYGDVTDIQIEGKNIQGLEIAVDDDPGEETLYVESSIDVIDRNAPCLRVVLPKEKQFQEVELELGASQAEIDGLLAENINMSIGTGEADLVNVHTKMMDIEVGAGRADIKNLTISNLNLEVGVGEANVQVNGAIEDFNYRIECGIGEVVVGNDSYGGLGAERIIEHSNTSCLIDIECGIGSVDMQFQHENKTDGTCEENVHHHK